MSIKLFIAGTDTGVGKTYISVGLLHAFQHQGYKTLGIKPVASGCQSLNQKLYNDDALLLQQASSIKLPYENINPFAFAPAIAPHIAAQQIGCELNLYQLNKCIQPALATTADICIIEGAGGWYTPLNETETLADFVIAQQFPVILVVGMRLGCLNHALLTLRAMQQNNVPIIGWVANCIDPYMNALNENITTLKTYLPVPCLGKVGNQHSIGNSFYLNLLQRITQLNNT